MLNFQGPTKPQQILYVFFISQIAHFQDKNGFVDRKELNDTLKDLLKHDGYTNFSAQEVITDVFRDLDRNGDGIIKKREFVFACTQCKDLMNMLIEAADKEKEKQER